MDGSVLFATALSFSAAFSSKYQSINHLFFFRMTNTIRQCVTQQGSTGSSADADKPARRVYKSVKVTKHSTVPYVKYSFQFLLYNSNFVFETCRFSDIRLQKMP